MRKNPKQRQLQWGWRGGSMEKHLVIIGSWGKLRSQGWLQKMVKRHMKICSTLLIVREMQIKTAMRYYLIPVRMAIIKKLTKNKHQRRCGEKGALLHCWWQYKLVQPLCRTVWRFLKKLKIELPYDPAIPLLGIYPEKDMVRKDTCTQWSLQCCLQKPRRGSNLNVYWQMNGYRRCGTYIQWNITQPLKRMK